MSNVTRVTLSLPAELCADLDEVCGALGLSRSAFISGMLSNHLPVAVAVVKTLGGDGEEQRGGRRYSEASMEGISSLIRGLSDAQTDLFNTK